MVHTVLSELNEDEASLSYNSRARVVEGLFSMLEALGSSTTK